MINPEHLESPQWMGQDHLMLKTAEIARSDQGTIAAAQYYLDSLNLVPKFVKSEGDDFAASRERLATKPGLVIANHPGDFDAPSIMSVINRRDLKIIASRKRMEELSTFGPDLFLPAAKSPGALRLVLRTVAEHIDSGGLLLTFPTGGQKRIDRSNRGFQSSFRAIVEKLKPDDMIYTFYINPTDVSGALSQMPEGTLQRLDQLTEIKIDEAYSEASEWQEVIRNSAKDEVNEKLREHFLAKFHRERFD